MQLRLGFVLTTQRGAEAAVAEGLARRFPALRLDQHFGKQPLLEKLLRLLEVNVQAALPALRHNIAAHLKVR